MSIYKGRCESRPHTGRDIILPLFSEYTDHTQKQFSLADSQIHGDENLLKMERFPHNFFLPVSRAIFPIENSRNHALNVSYFTLRAEREPILSKMVFSVRVKIKHSNIKKATRTHLRR